MCLSRFKKKRSKEDIEIHEIETTVGLDGGKPTILKRSLYKKTDKSVVSANRTDIEKNNNVIEKEFSIKPGQFEEVTLGRIERGRTLSIEGRGKLGANFSVYIVDLDNLKLYRKDGLVKGATYHNADVPEVNDKVTIKQSTDYFLIVTSRAVEKTRKVWIRLEVQ